MEVAVGTFIPALNSGSDIAITGVGFTPKFGIFMAGGQIMSDTTGWGAGGWGYGIAGDTDDQAVISQGASKGTMGHGVNSTSGSLIRTLGGDSGNPPPTFGNSQLGSWDTDGFTIYTSATHISAAGPSVSYMVCGGTQILDVELVSQGPTTDITGFGFDPNFLLSIIHGSTSASMGYTAQADSDEGAGLVVYQENRASTARPAGRSWGQIVANYPVVAAYDGVGGLGFGLMDGYITDGYQQNITDTGSNMSVQYTLGVQFSDDAAVPYYGTLTPSTDTSEQQVQLPKRGAGLLFVSHSQGGAGGGYAYTKVATSTVDLAGFYLNHGTGDTAGGSNVQFASAKSTDATIAVVGSTAGITASMVLTELNNTDFKWQMSAESTGITVHYWVLPGVYTSAPAGDVIPSGEITGKGIGFNVRGVLTFVSRLPRNTKSAVEGFISFARTITRSVGILLWELAINIFSTDINFTQYNPKANIVVAPGSTESGPIIMDDLEVK